MKQILKRFFTLFNNDCSHMHIWLTAVTTVRWFNIYKNYTPKTKLEERVLINCETNMVSECALHCCEGI